ncbi:hypothetical protein THAOC_36984 [Thalassiosira oceanica]|uniref:Uncharacterized protein n=1 Tax=Thalassiosira oceanica TaxID=159749 RepID=K0R0X1_THAOC|nr:hypothetical protein THAOC_36984 [Thalassiosira oceanica]|eukprot:EJK44469.1 hypothetical protein THAOC_36984 [Thalassiosira oceanica]
MFSSVPVKEHNCRVTRRGGLRMVQKPAVDLNAILAGDHVRLEGNVMFAWGSIPLDVLVVVKRHRTDGREVEERKANQQRRRSRAEAARPPEEIEKKILKGRAHSSIACDPKRSPSTPAQRRFATRHTQDFWTLLDTRSAESKDPGPEKTDRQKPQAARSTATETGGRVRVFLTAVDCHYATNTARDDVSSPPRR